MDSFIICCILIGADCSINFRTYWEEKDVAVCAYRAVKAPVMLF